MTSESLVQEAVIQIWKMTRHTQSICCNRYTQVNHERICRKCMTKSIRAFYEHADAMEAN